MEKYKVYWTDVAKKDLYDIIEYISFDSKEIAKKKLNKIKIASLKLSDFPETGRIVPELKKQNIDKYRELIISHWRLLYRIDQNKVFVLTVINGRRNIEDILLARNLR